MAAKRQAAYREAQNGYSLAAQSVILRKKRSQPKRLSQCFYRKFTGLLRLTFLNQRHYSDYGLEPIEIFGTPGRIRTCGLRIRRSFKTFLI